MNMKKIAIIGTAGLPARYGGFETLAHHLVQKLNDRFKLTVYCSNTYYSKEERVAEWNKARLVYLPFNANGAQSIIYDIISIIHALFFADALIVLGVSGGILIPFVKLFTRKKIIVNIDGLEWRRQKWSSPIKRFLKFSEYLAVKYSDADITDNAAIQKYTAINYKTLSHLIEYGADHVINARLERKDYKQFPFLSNPYAFKVCRIEPENNVHVILNAFSQELNKTIVLVGNWSASDYGIELREKFDKYPNIYMLDPIYDQLQLDKLRSNCHVYLHGHSAGGTNPSLVEAMYLGLPIIAFDVSYNRATTEDQAIFFSNEDQLLKHIHQLTLLDYKRQGSKMREIALRRYTWEKIAQKYANLVYAFDYSYHKKPVKSRIEKIQYTNLLVNGMAHLKSPVKFYQNTEKNGLFNN